MKTEKIVSLLKELDRDVAPSNGKEKTKAVTINGFIVRAMSNILHGHSGKGYTTYFFVNGERIARAKLVKLLSCKTN